MKRMMVWMGIGVVGLNVMAAELGRRDVTVAAPAPMTPSGIPIQKGYSDGFITDGGVGLEVGGSFNAVNWDLGGDSFSDEVWSPELALFYGINDTFDLRATFKWGTMEDIANENMPDEYAGDMTFYRIGIGAKGWFNTDSDFIPFVGVGLNYYIVDVDEGSSASGMLGLSGSVGLAYAANEQVSVQLSLQGEISLSEGSVDLTQADGTDSEEDISFDAVGVGVAVSVVF